MFVEPVTAERKGYKFVGWYEDEDFVLPYDFGKTVEDAGELTLYAKWEKDGSGEPDTTTTPAVTTNPDITTTPSGTTTPSVTTKGDGKGGCKSVMGAGASIAVIGIIGAALAVGQKKKEE